jgi:hypothetical protein
MAATSLGRPLGTTMKTYRQKWTTQRCQAASG